MLTSLLLAASLAALSPCDDSDPLRRAYFGDTHIHTSWSLDASTRMGTRTDPDDAYRFARGGKLDLQPYDSAGKALRSLQNRRALDFAAVTDHAESYRIVRICDDEDNPGYNSWICQNYGPLVGVLAPYIINWADLGLDNVDYCGPQGSYCDSAYRQVWQDTVAAATRHNTTCEFTAFNGYEWSGGSGGSNLHRNVIFAGDNVVDTPVSALEQSQVEGLWQALDEQCLAEAGCSVITIPHNMNLSDGKMFSSTMTDGQPITEKVARQRQRYERLAEIMQQKGDSECFPGSADELCNFEKVSYNNFRGKFLPFLDGPTVDDSRYMREALREGLRIESGLGVNPFTPGFIASTDTHTGAAGGVQEDNYGGHHGDQLIVDSLPVDKQLVDNIDQGPGGLAVLYAEENTRASLFAAMQRREAYGTSGTRIGLRFFAGADLPADICGENDLVAQAYEHGVPMGGELDGEALAGGAPQFVVTAQQDPLGTPLQRIQIVKGWLDASGRSKELVYDIARVDGEASVDLDSCQPKGKGAAALCAHWQDPGFESGKNAWYYARVVENPSCRWTTFQCLNAQVDCSNPGSVPEVLQPCCDASVPSTIQERAWSSPIWVSP